MNRTSLVIAILAATVAVGCLTIARARSTRDAGTASAARLAESLESRALDLTYPFDEDTIYWPTDESFHWEKVKWGRPPGDHWYATARYSASEHGGTHLDSPIHFGEGQETTDQIPLTRLIGPAVVVDVSEACSRDPDYLVSVADLTAWEAAHGPIPAGAIVLVHTGWGRFWPDKARYLGCDQPGDVADLHFPGIAQDAARWLASDRRVDGVGIDTASLDHGPSRDFLAHQALNGAGVFGLENVAHLERVPATGAVLIALPMKIKGGTGGPTRIIAILPEE